MQDRREKIGQKKQQICNDVRHCSFAVICVSSLDSSGSVLTTTAYPVSRQYYAFHKQNRFINVFLTQVNQLFIYKTL